MTNYVLDGHGLSAVFDTSISPISFSEDPRNHIPKTGSIIYSFWDKDKNFIYIGISGLQKSSDRRNVDLFQQRWFKRYLTVRKIWKRCEGE